MLNPKCKDKDTLAQIQYAVDDEKDAKVLDNQQVLKTPIVRNGTKATIGYVPEIWKTWEWVLGFDKNQTSEYTYGA